LFLRESNCRPTRKVLMTSVLETLAMRSPGSGLPRPFYTDPAFFEADLAHVFHREWIFAGHDCEIARPGDWLTLQVGAYPVLVVRGRDGAVRAFHNVCRHRGFKLCAATHGSAPRRLVCPYHQWAYELDGRLARARDMAAAFDAGAHGLKPVHAASAGGTIFVCVAAEPPDFATLRTMIDPYLAPFDLANAKVAFESRIVEHGNWKIVWENNRECYHCRASHPELCRSFPEAPTHSGGGGEEDRHKVERLVEKCEAMGLPGRYRLDASGQFRMMRLPLEGEARSMTMTGRPAVARRLGRLPAEENIGDLLFFHLPSTWCHYTADHALSFRVLPLSATLTELVTRWLVPREAVEGADYDLATLTEVWLATNEQDRALVERTQAGVDSPAFEPGTYSPVHEEGVLQFLDWYCATMRRRLGGPALRQAAE
jgi:Rieske 2Fe-2S family protein